MTQISKIRSISNQVKKKIFLKKYIYKGHLKREQKNFNNRLGTQIQLNVHQKFHKKLEKKFHYISPENTEYQTQ